MSYGVISATRCLVCTAPLRDNGGTTLYCSRGKAGCRRKRTQISRARHREITLWRMAGRLPWEKDPSKPSPKERASAAVAALGAVMLGQRR